MGGGAGFGGGAMPFGASGGAVPFGAAGGAVPFGAAHMGGAPMGGAPMGGAPVGGALMGGAPMGAAPQTQEVMLPQDMGCTEIPRGPIWARAKASFREIYGEAGTPPFYVAPRDTVTTMLNNVMNGLQSEKALSPEAQDECGFGKYFLQLSTISSADDANSVSEMIRGIEQVSSPLLTILLDIPWAGTAQSSWPFFGLLAQVSLRKQQEGAETLNDLQTDGLEDASAQEFFQALINAMPSTDLAAMVQASSVYLEASPKSGATLPFFTAVAAQAAVAPLEQRLEALQVIQRAFKRSIQDAGGLEVVLSTRWPLWTLLHMAVTPLAVSGS